MYLPTCLLDHCTLPNRKRLHGWLNCMKSLLQPHHKQDWQKLKTALINQGPPFIFLQTFLLSIVKQQFNLVVNRSFPWEQGNSESTKLKVYHKFLILFLRHLVPLKISTSRCLENGWKRFLRGKFRCFTKSSSLLALVIFSHGTNYSDCWFNSFKSSVKPIVIE